MIIQHDVDIIFQEAQHDSLSITDEDNNASIVLNHYQGGPITGAPEDYFVCLWETVSAITEISDKMLSNTINMHKNLADLSEFPRSRLVFDLYWLQHGQNSTKLNHNLVSMDTDVLPHNVNVSTHARIGQNRFIRLDGQFFSLVIDDISDRPNPAGLLKDSRTSVGLISMFDISQGLVSLYKISTSASQGRGVLNYDLLANEIAEIIPPRFLPWDRITAVGGQLNQRQP